MSRNMLFRRSLTTLIPPKIVSSNQVAKAPNAKRVSNMVNFYKSLPQGPAPKNNNQSGFINWYKAKYFEKDSVQPLLHLTAAILVFSYSLDYYFHLRHHKGGEH